MEISQCQALVMIHQEGTFTRAAECLHVSQPALSQQIKALERELGLLLFERRGRQLTWTPVGEIVLLRAKAILQQLDQLQMDIAALFTLEQGRLRIGTSDTICLYLLPAVMQAYRERHPRIDIHLMNRPSQEIVARLQEGAIDFGIVTLPVQGQGVETSYLCDRQDVAVCAPAHPLAHRETENAELTVAELTVTELIAHQLLLLERGTTSRSFLDQLFAQAGVVPQAMELGSIEVLKQYAAINLGVAVVPEMSIREEVSADRLRVFRLPWVPPRAIGLVTRRNSYETPAVAAFLELLTAMIH